MAWLTNWNRRKPIIINGATGTQTNYQMKLVAYKSAGTDTPGNIYLGTNVRNDFGDVRFTSSDGSTLLNYWIESYTSGVSAIVWIQIDSIPASPSSSTIYIYYDNSSQVTTSNGAQTFDFFGDALNKFTTQGSTWSLSGTILKLDASVHSWKYAYTPPFQIPYVVETTVTTDTGNLVGEMPTGIIVGYSGTGSGSEDGMYVAKGGRNLYTNGAFHSGSDTSSVLGKAKVVVKSTTNVVTYWNDVLITDYTSRNVVDNKGVGIVKYYAGIGEFTNFRVRKYVSPEPIWSCSGIEEPSTVSWLTGWNRRKYVTINGSTTGAQTNYQMQITVYKSSGTDSGNTVYLGVNVKDDFSDIRFTRNDGVTLLNYWIDPSSIISGTSATVLVQVDSIPLSPCTGKIYLYYNNASASSISNGSATFILFDDFNDSNYDGWTVVSGQWSAVLGFLRSGTSGTQEIKIPSNTAYGAWEWKFRTNGFSNSEMFFKIMSAGNGISNSQYAHRVNPLSGAYFDIRRDVGGSSFPVDSSWTVDTNWHKIKITRNQNGLFELFLDDTSKGTGTDNTITSTSSLAIFTEGIQNYDFDDIRIRRYITPEPTFGIWSAEESVVCNVPSCNLIILEILSEQLSRTYPEYIDLEIVSKLLDDF